MEEVQARNGFSNGESTRVTFDTSEPSQQNHHDPLHTLDNITNDDIKELLAPNAAPQAQGSQTPPTATGSTMSLLSIDIDSDAVSINSMPLLNLDIEDLDDEEYGIPPVEELPSLESVLASDDGGLDDFDGNLLNVKKLPSDISPIKKPDDAASRGSLLKYIFLQGVSQQITSAAERIGAGIGSAVTGFGDKIAVGTSHGLVMAFTCQVLRWCCQQNKDQAAVTSLDYNEDASRLLAGFARGFVVMYESNEGTILRTVEACGGGPWGVLSVRWGPNSIGSGSSAIVADTGGSVWLLRFTRVMGVRGTKVSCLFSGARGEVCSVEPLYDNYDNWGGILALATLSRVVIVWGVGTGNRLRAGCQVSLHGPPDNLPLLAWEPIVMSTKTVRKDPVLCSARGNHLQFHQIKWGTMGPEALLLKKASFSYDLSALKWFGGRRLALLDTKETLHLWDISSASVIEVLDLSNAQLVYASAHFKGVATGGKVSEALALAGASALGGATAGGGVAGAILLLGRAGLHRISVRAAHAAAHHHADMGRWQQALDTVVNEYKCWAGRSRQSLCRQRADTLLCRLAADPVQLSDSTIALATVDACIEMQLLDTLWNVLWEAAMTIEKVGPLATAISKRASEGLITKMPPAICQYIVDQLAVTDTQKLQKILLHMSVECLDLHQVLSECRKLGLWKAWVRVTSQALRDPPLPLKELLPIMGHSCRNGHYPVKNHSCPGDALLVYIADCFGGRDFPSGLLPASDRHAVRHEIMACLLFDGDDNGVPLPHLRALLLHDTGSTLRMLGMAYSEPPFMGPMGKLNRLKMTMAIHNVIKTAVEPDLFSEEEIAEVMYFTSHHLSNGLLPPDINLINNLKDAFSKKPESVEAKKILEKAWLNIFTCVNNIVNHFPTNEMMELAQEHGYLKVERYLLEKAGKYSTMLSTFLNDEGSEIEMFAYLEKYASVEDRMIPQQISSNFELMATRWPSMFSKFLIIHFPNLIPSVYVSITDEEKCLVFSHFLYELGALDAETSVKHLELLCKLKPSDVLHFVYNTPSTLPPSKCLEIIQKYNIKEAEPKCLETCGDLQGALKASIKLMLEGKTKEERETLAFETCSLCIRASKSSSVSEAENLWKELIEGIADLPEPPGAPLPSLLLEGAASYLPLPWLVSKLCGGGGQTGALRGALLGLIEAAKGSALAVKITKKITGIELHKSLVSSLRARKILPVSCAKCCTCHNPLHTKPMIRAYYCGHAFHLECDPVAGRCGRCGTTATEVRLPRNIPSMQTRNQQQPQQFALNIVAPPRPDLEGII